MYHNESVYIDDIINAYIHCYWNLVNILLIAECTCSEYVSSSGYGNCRKDHKGGPICYVNLPSECNDLVGSSKYPDRKYSWEACKNVGFGAFQIPAK